MGAKPSCMSDEPPSRNRRAPSCTTRKTTREHIYDQLKAYTARRGEEWRDSEPESLLSGFDKFRRKSSTPQPTVKVKVSEQQDESSPAFHPFGPTRPQSNIIQLFSPATMSATSKSLTLKESILERSLQSSGEQRPSNASASHMSLQTLAASASDSASFDIAEQIIKKVSNLGKAAAALAVATSDHTDVRGRGINPQDTLSQLSRQSTLGRLALSKTMDAFRKEQAAKQKSPTGSGSPVQAVTSEGQDSLPGQRKSRSSLDVRDIKNLRNLSRSSAPLTIYETGLGKDKHRELEASASVKKAVSFTNVKSRHCKSSGSLPMIQSTASLKDLFFGAQGIQNTGEKKHDDPDSSTEPNSKRSGDRFLVKIRSSFSDTSVPIETYTPKDGAGSRVSSAVRVRSRSSRASEIRRFSDSSARHVSTREDAESDKMTELLGLGMDEEEREFDQNRHNCSNFDMEKTEGDGQSTKEEKQESDMSINHEFSRSKLPEVIIDDSHSTRVIVTAPSADEATELDEPSLINRPPEEPLDVSEESSEKISKTDSSEEEQKDAEFEDVPLDDEPSHESHENTSDSDTAMLIGQLPSVEIDTRNRFTNVKRFITKRLEESKSTVKLLGDIYDLLASRVRSSSVPLDMFTDTTGTSGTGSGHSADSNVSLEEKFVAQSGDVPPSGTQSLVMDASEELPVPSAKRSSIRDNTKSTASKTLTFDDDVTSKGSFKDKLKSKLLFKKNFKKTKRKKTSKSKSSELGAETKRPRAVSTTGVLMGKQRSRVAPEMMMQKDKSPLQNTSSGSILDSPRGRHERRYSSTAVEPGVKSYTTKSLNGKKNENRRATINIHTTHRKSILHDEIPCKHKRSRSICGHVR